MFPVHTKLVIFPGGHNVLPVHCESFNILSFALKEVTSLDRKSEVYLNLNAVMESCFRFSIIESVFGIHIYFFDFSPNYGQTLCEKKNVM